MRRTPTIGETFAAASGYTTGFDYLRIGLAMSVLCWHSLRLSGSDLELAIRSGVFGFFPNALIPMFFALSGFLVANSLQRSKLREFITLRIVRIVPALAVEVTLSAIVLGAIFTSLPLCSYFSHPGFYAYFLNIIGLVHFELPGVFTGDARSPFVNAQLWTIPVELNCYLLLILLSVFKLTARRRLLAILLAVLCVAFATWSFVFSTNIQNDGDVGGLATLCFLAAVVILLNRDKIPNSAPAGYASLVISIIFLSLPAASFFAAIPIAYATVWLGLKRPPRMPFGDLSYGIYLFHFPIEQTMMHVWPQIDSWWQLSLLTLPVVMVIAWLSWTFIESPVLSRKKIIVESADRICSGDRKFLHAFRRAAQEDRRHRRRFDTQPTRPASAL